MIPAENHLKRNPDGSSRADRFLLRPIWKVYPALQRPLVGMCLSISEQRRILKKCGFSIKKEKPHEIHKLIMANIAKKNRVSRKIERLLKHKYRNDIATYNSLSEEQLTAEWESKLRSGNIEGLFCVLATRDNVSESFLREVQGEIHMMAHGNTNDTLKSRRSLYVELAVNQKLASRCNKMKLTIKKLIQRREIQNARIRKLQTKAVQNPAGQAEKSTAHLHLENQRLTKQIKALEEKSSESLKTINLQEREKRKLQIKLFDLQSSNKLLVNELETLLTQITTSAGCHNKCGSPCSNCELCARRILIVGGMTKMKPFYRNLIESCGGEFDYHDGYMKGGQKNLEERILKSDVILCPVNCNSHNACRRVKKMCKKHNKSIKMLANSSLNSISNALIESYPVRN